jgi:hypothetical protein
VRVETREIIKTATYDYRGEIDDLLTSGMGNVALKLTGQKITKTETTQVYETPTKQPTVSELVTTEVNENVDITEVEAVVEEPDKNFSRSNVRKSGGIGIGLLGFDGVPVGEGLTLSYVLFFDTFPDNYPYTSVRSFMGYGWSDSLVNLNIGMEFSFSFNDYKSKQLVKPRENGGKGITFAIGGIGNFFSTDLTSSLAGEDIFSIYLKSGRRGVFKQNWYIDLYLIFPLYEYHRVSDGTKWTVSEHLKFWDYNQGVFITFGYLINESFSNLLEKF